MTQHRGMARMHKAAHRGTSLIEVLVSLVIISVALLGGVGMQLRALQLGKSSEFRNQAVLLASDLAERMEANKEAAASAMLDGAYAVAKTSAPPSSMPSCSTACTAAQQAALDLYQWQTQIASLLPGSAWAVRQTTHGNPNSYEISIEWADGHGDQAFGSNVSDVIASYVATRTIYQP